MKKINLIAFITTLCLITGIVKAQYTDLWNFETPSHANGIHPWGSVTMSGNALYGMAQGGPGTYGYIFSIHTNGSSYKDILTFNSTNGSDPFGSLTLSTNGQVLYGMTYEGGVHGQGCIFSIDTNGSGYKDLFDFDGSNGAYPNGDLTLSGGVLYGMTSYGGVNEDGIVFSIDTNGSYFKDLLDFNDTNGSSPNGDLTISGGGYME